LDTIQSEALRAQWHLPRARRSGGIAVTAMRPILTELPVLLSSVVNLPAINLC
jgi:hypothetical protein